jgi:hypothetical protein
MACQFKDIFGKPNTGVHKHRFLGMASFDLIGTVIISIAIAYFYQLSYIKTILYAFLIGAAVHWIFCVDTAFMNLLKALY